MSYYNDSDYDYLKALEESNREIDLEIEQVENDQEIKPRQKTKLIAELRGQQAVNEKSKGLFNWRK